MIPAMTKPDGDNRKATHHKGTLTSEALTDTQIRIARHLTVAAALTGVQNASKIHYTQGTRRWDGIKHANIAAGGYFPAYADCSSFVTWCLWNGLKVPFDAADTVNGENWQAGFTGTLAEHGHPVPRIKDARLGDLILYGPPAPYKHVTVYIGNGKVVSHGSEAGPLVADYNYRPDVAEIRRYIY